MIFKVNWDNGNHACGTFPCEFKTFKEADEYGTNWVFDMKFADEMNGGDYSHMDDPTYTIDTYENS
jgi:hypothetical protein